MCTFVNKLFVEAVCNTEVRDSNWCVHAYFHREHLVMSDFVQESVVKDVLQERDEYDIVSTDSGSGGEEDPEKINGDLDEVHPPSPPPRPQHTLSKQSFAIDGERLDKICLLPNTPLLKVRKNATCNVQAPLLVASNHSSKRKPSWRNQRPPVSTYH